MYKGKKILAVITARGGSKRLSNKNILDLAGKPLIAWTIGEANKSKYLDKVIVSTDSEKIAEVSKYYGADVPFLRPENLSNDTADSISVIKHSIEFFNKEEYEYVMLLQPTSPLRTVGDIDGAIEMLDVQTESVVSVTEVDHSPLWVNTLPEDLSMKNFIGDKVKNKRSQDLPTYYRLNGAIYVSEINYFYNIGGFMGDKTRAYVMEPKNSVDIDTKFDFIIAKSFIEEK